MKKTLLLILLASSIAFPIFSANDNGDDSESETIELEIKDNASGPSNGNHRSSIFSFIEASLYRNKQILEICYYGENNGEIFIYHNNILVNYSSELNTTFQFTGSGLYKIEIIEEFWTATGYIQL